MTHCGVLVNADDDSRLKPDNFFGDLHSWKPEEYLTTEEIQDIQVEILSVLNENRTKPYSVGSDGVLCYLGDGSATDKHSLKELGYLPLKEFVPYDEFSGECLDAWLKSIENPENRVYVEYLVSERSRILKDKTIPQKSGVYS
ncbi:hypothetical protein V7O67_05125 [Methanolobus sp. ZRKC4]|uniref:hypothetical protein n=1 Tax=Methanolobus sp. ZRKC4 TaxID=3125787 RepID=UPI00324AB003